MLLVALTRRVSKVALLVTGKAPQEIKCPSQKNVYQGPYALVPFFCLMLPVHSFLIMKVENV